MKRLGGSKGYRSTLFFAVTMLVMVLLFVVPASATRPKEKFDTEAGYIGYPGNIPAFGNYSTTQMEPGGSDIFGFTIHNRYDTEITNINVDLEIYFQGRIDERKDVVDINDPPYFVESQNQTLSQDLGTLAAWNSTLEIRELLKTKSSTREGAYFVKLILSFDYNETRYIMKSRGHFTDEVWYEATTDTEDLDDSGAIDLTVLEVDGLVPETSFGVRRNVVFWPVTLLGVMAGRVAGLTVLVYLLEEETYPQLNKRIEEQRRKGNEFWFSLKQRKGKS